MEDKALRRLADSPAWHDAKKAIVRRVVGLRDIANIPKGCAYETEVEIRKGIADGLGAFVAAVDGAQLDAAAEFERQKSEEVAGLNFFEA